MRMIALSLALIAALASAQDCPPCGGGKPALEVDEAKLLATDLKQARGSMEEAVRELKMMPAEQREELAKARSFLMEKTEGGRAVLQTFVACALHLEAAAKESKSDPLLSEMAKCYRAMAVTCTPGIFGEDDAKTALTKANKAIEAFEKKAEPTAEQKEREQKAMTALSEGCPVYGEVGSSMELLSDGLAMLAKRCKSENEPNASVAAVLKLNGRLGKAMDCGSGCGSCGDCGGSCSGDGSCGGKCSGDKSCGDCGGSCSGDGSCGGKCGGDKSCGEKSGSCPSTTKPEKAQPDEKKPEPATQSS